MKHSPSSSGDFGSFCHLLDSWTDERFGLWLFSSVAASHCWFVYSTPQRTMIFFFCLFFNSLHCLFGSSSRSLLADGELCWDVEFVVGVKFRRCSKTCERAQCRLSASSPGLDTLHFLASIQRQLELKTFRKRLKSGLNSNLFWVESDASPASEGFYFVEVRQP